MVNFLRKLGVLPVYRKHVLKYVYKNRKNYAGLCEAIDFGLDAFNLRVPRHRAFPEYSKENAEQFIGHELDSPYWWGIRNWEGGRSEYLEHLIQLYENDKTNLRKVR